MSTYFKKRILEVLTKTPTKPLAAAPKPVDTSRKPKPATSPKAPTAAIKPTPKPSSVSFPANSSEWHTQRRNRVLKSFDTVSADVILSATNRLNDVEFEKTITDLEKDLMGVSK